MRVILASGFWILYSFSMRQAFVRQLSKIMDQDDSVYLLTADTGFHVLDDFQKDFPDRYLNVGISEAAMIGMAAGMALAGKKVFVYGIAPFVTLRCFEQIRVDLCYARLPVKIVGVGGGLTYGPSGATHHTIEDIAVMRALPGMTVICPGDPVETEAAVQASLALSGPCYFRLGKSGEPVVHAQGLPNFAIGRGIVIHEGGHPAIVATGNMLETAVHVYDALKAAGLAPTLVSMPTLKPLDEELIERLAQACPVMATIEEHSRIGGLGSAVAEFLMARNLSARLLTFALPDEYETRAGSQEYFREKHGLAPDSIVRNILKVTG